MLRLQVGTKDAPNRAPEWRYLGAVLADYLGIPVRLDFAHKLSDLCWSLPGEKGEIRLPINLLAKAEKEWLKPSSLPRGPLAQFDLQEHNLHANLISSPLPILFPSKVMGSLYEEEETPQGKRISINFDLLGGIFFMLTRYEELVKQERDRHQRFPARASLAFQEGFLDRPIVNEYVELLWQCMHQLWPNLQRKKREFRIQVSHDVDHPYQHRLQPLHHTLRPVAGDLIKRRSMFQAFLRLKEICEVRQDRRLDPFDTFSWLMDQSEKNNIRSHFYFKAGRKTDFDEGYNLRHPSIQAKLFEIDRRGHLIGFHPGYYTYKDENEWNSQWKELQAVSPQELTTGRQHYLRLEAPTTWRIWESAGFELDSTLGYADEAGFRSGTCFEHALFDLQNRCQLKLRELPLIVMDCTLLGANYMGIPSHDKAVALVRQLKETCKKFSGVFTLLWHNSYLGKPGYPEVYTNLIMPYR